MCSNREEELRDLARAMRVEADAATDAINAERLRDLARTYERRAENLRRDGPVGAGA